MDLIKLVGRPIPALPSARDVILHGLLAAPVRVVSTEDSRLLAVLPDLIHEGIIVEGPNGISLAPGARDAASSAATRITAFREARARWGEDLQAALRRRRAFGRVDVQLQ